jgi:hypothetical protein
MKKKMKRETWSSISMPIPLLYTSLECRTSLDGKSRFLLLDLFRGHERLRVLLGFPSLYHGQVQMIV